jgi:hypothetical protein
LMVILSLWNPETLFELYKSFSFIAKNHNLHYVPVKVISNQASKQPRTINNALKMQRILFLKIPDIKNKLLIIIYADINECSKKDQFFSYKISSFFSSPSLWKPIKTKGHLIIYFHRRPHCQTQEHIISFLRKKITKELQDFKSKLF